MLIFKKILFLIAIFFSINIQLSAEENKPKYSYAGTQELAPLVAITSGNRSYGLTNKIPGISVINQDKVDFDIGRLKKGEAYTLSVNAPQHRLSYWAMSFSYLSTVSENDVDIALVGVSQNGNKFPLFSEKALSNNFINVNLGKDTVGNYVNRLQITIKKKNLNASGVFSLLAPRLNAKKDFLANNNIVNYINVDTIKSLTQEQENQLKTLFNSGHRIWVLSRLRPKDILSGEVVNLIRQNKVLSQFKFIINLPSLGSNRFCDFEFYEDRKGNTLNYTPSEVAKAGSKKRYNHRKMKKVVMRNNCARAYSSSSNASNDKELRKFLTYYVNVVKQNIDLFVGLYTFDEASSFGINRDYQEDIYQYFNKYLPNLPVILTHSFYLGIPVITDRHPREWIERYLTPHSADIFFFDHYTNQTLSKGKTKRQKRMAKFMQKHGMLNKPFIKLFGTAINKRWPCTSVAMHKKVFTLTKQSFSSSITWDKRKNWNNMGFWAFQDREAFKRHRPSWQSTLAMQKKGFCQNQFQAVLEMSREN